MKNSFRKTIRVSNSLDPGHVRHFVGSDLGQTVSKGYQQMLTVGKELKMNQTNLRTPCDCYTNGRSSVVECFTGDRGLPS